MNDTSSALNLAIEACLCAEPEEKVRLLADVARRLKALTDSDRPACELALRRLVDGTLDYTSAQSLYRIRRRLAASRPEPAKIRVAIVGSFTTDQLTALIDLFMFAAGLDAEFYEADYGLFRQEILDPSSGLYAFKPSFIYIATHWRDIGQRPRLTDTEAAVTQRADAEVSEWTALWKTAFERTGAQIVHNNFDQPNWRQLSNHEARHPAGFNRFIGRLNGKLADAAPPYVTLYDIDDLSASAGRVSWGDERFYLQAKLPCAPPYLVDYAQGVASLFAAQSGVGKKCLVLDLDNTLWGGVIGDDGLGGIRLGQGDPESEAYLAFQRYVKALQMRGVILAVCSKNEESNAREVFEKHPEMLLRMDDISCFVANWTDKASNIRAIAKRLDIGLNSLVFVDDNPAERSVVRQLLPEVAVPELPVDPSGYVSAVDQHRYFQVVALSAEDFQRTDFYKANEARVEAQSSAQSIDDFLKSLAMVGRVATIDASNLERSVQLINRSNQFNLTTHRYASGELLALLKDPRWITRTVSLADRFGDNGLISVLICKVEGADLLIDTWLMSCRVLKRNVEAFVLQHLIEVARHRKLSRIVGEYKPTPKNGLVRDHYATLGFSASGGDPDGSTRWELDVSGSSAATGHHIHLASDSVPPTL